MSISKIGYIAPSLDDTTGWGRWVNDFLRHMSAAGIRPVVFAPASSERHWRAPSAEAEAHFVLPELFDALQSLDGLRHAPALARLWLQGFSGANMELVHSLDAYPWGMYGDWLARRVGAPHVLTTHGRYGYIAEHHAVDRLAYGRVLARSAHMIAVSDAVRREVLRAFGERIRPELVSVLQNPVDANQFSQGESWPFPEPTGPVVLSVTRFVPVKDIETAVRAFRIVRRSIPDACYYIVGPGNGERNSYFRSIRDLIQREGINGVQIVGRVTKDVLSAFYRRAALLVHTAKRLPDDFEASGLILLEAGLFGVPVVASASGGIPEVVEEGVTGRLVAEGNVAQLADAIVDLLRSPERRQRLGAGNHQRALNRNWVRYQDDQLRLYASLAGAS
jgi:glycosyltransferase involved in cell wall biosynthesis